MRRFKTLDEILPRINPEFWKLWGRYVGILLLGMMGVGIVIGLFSLLVFITTTPIAVATGIFLLIIVILGASAYEEAEKLTLRKDKHKRMWG
jgi:hypothetical protein